jgi:AcrR family transcriptional regulator
VTEVADAALVSKATAYRYFPTQEALLVELPLDEDAPTVGSLFGDGAPADAEERAALVQNALYDLAREHETEFRVFLRASLTRSLRDGNGGGDPLRGARRDALLAEALAPLADELPLEEVERLRTAVAMLVGVESMIVLRDVLHLDHDDARQVGEWAVRQLVRAARHGMDDATEDGHIS